jgi:sterol 3beta-glucosyltransferase
LKEGLSEISKVLDVNVLVVKGWGFEDIAPSERNSFKIIASAPFDKLFPKVDAVVHHGGIGTLSLCLRAGVPSLSCPVIYPMGDQHFWGNHAFKIGCAAKPIPLKKLNLQGLMKSVDGMLTNQSLRDNCKAIARKLALENGLEHAADIIESHFSFYATRANEN